MWNSYDILNLSNPAGYNGFMTILRRYNLWTQNTQTVLQDRVAYFFKLFVANNKYYYLGKLE